MFLVALSCCAGIVLVSLCIALTPMCVVAQNTDNRREPQSRALAVPSPQSNNTTLLSEATSLMQAGRLDEAEALARRAVTSFPLDGNAHTLLGVILDQLGRSTEAESEFRGALKIDRWDIHALANLGVLLARTGQAEKAIETFETVLKIDPAHQQAAYNLGMLYAARGDYKRATPLLERAAKGTSEFSSAHEKETGVVLVRAYLHEGRSQDAIRISDAIERSAGIDVRILFSLGLSFAEANEYAYAVKLFRRAESIRADTFEIPYNLGVALYNLDKLDEAKIALQKAASISPNEPEPFYRLGLIASARGDSEAALGLWQRALQLRPNFAEANFMIAEELFRNRRIENSIAFYERAVAQDRTKLIYQIRFGAARFRLQQYGLARQVFETALSRFPRDANLYYLIGYTARAEGLYDEAITAFNQALELEPANPEVLANLGFIASERGKNEEAEQLLRRAIKGDQKNFAAYYDLGRLLVRTKRYDEAIPILQRATDLNSTDPGVHYQLFTVMSRLKRTEDASRELAVFKGLEAERKRKEANGSGSATDNPSPPAIVHKESVAKPGP